MTAARQRSRLRAFAPFRFRPIYFGILVAVPLAAAQVLAAGRDFGAPSPAADSEQIRRGAVLYRLHCAGCHGKEGQGDGHAAEKLELDIPDLTLMARRNRGVFPAEATRRAIDGRTELRGHTRRNMPIWGLGLQQPGRDSAQEGDVQMDIEELVLYLKTLQEPGF
jgi:mono/diheme cytochrome c family protein